MRAFFYEGLGRNSAEQPYFCFPIAIQGSLGNTTRYYNEINSILLYYVNTLLYLNSNQLCAHFKSLTSKIKVCVQKLFRCEVLIALIIVVNSKSIEFELAFSHELLTFNFDQLTTYTVVATPRIIETYTSYKL